MSTRVCFAYTIPGPTGPSGNNGTVGTNGINAFTLLDGGFTMPAEQALVTVTVLDNRWMALGQIVFVQNAGFFSVAALNPDNLGVTLFNLADTPSGFYLTNAAPGSAIPGQSKVSPGGLQGPGTGGGAAGALLAVNNLNDVANQALSRTNLGLGTLAQQDSNALNVTGGIATGLTLIDSDTIINNLALQIAGTLNLVPLSVSLVATDTLPTNKPKLRVAGNGGAVVMVSTPTIGTPISAGEPVLLILGTSSSSPVTFQSESVLPGSGLVLGASTRTVSRGDQLFIAWDYGLATWIEVAYMQASGVPPSTGVSPGGLNYSFGGAGASTIFRLKNLDTGLYNQIDTYGADGSQGVQVYPGSASAPDTVIAPVGANYRFEGEGAAAIFRFKNIDTALFNRPDAAGADGSQDLLLLNGVGAGAASSVVFATGANYRFAGSGASTIFSFRNSDTGLYNRIDTAGADGSQTYQLGNGTI